MPSTYLQSKTFMEVAKMTSEKMGVIFFKLHGLNVSPVWSAEFCNKVYQIPEVLQPV